MPKCPFRHFESAKTCLIMPTRKFWEVSAETTACGGDDLFLIFLGGPEYRTSGDVMPFKEPVLLHSKNVVTLSYVDVSLATKFVLFKSATNRNAFQTRLALAVKHTRQDGFATCVWYLKATVCHNENCFWHFLVVVRSVVFVC